MINMFNRVGNAPRVFLHGNSSQVAEPLEKILNGVDGPSGRPSGPSGWATERNPPLRSVTI